MRILALDLGTEAGFAIGEAGAIPHSDSVRLKKPSEHRAVLFYNFAKLLGDLAPADGPDRPDLVVYEDAMRAGPGSWSGDGVEVAHGLVAVLWVYLMARRIRWESVNVLTWRKHFTGRGSWKGPGLAKAKTIERCHQLGYMPPEAKNNNRADACGVFDYASNVFGRTAPSFQLSQEAIHA